MRPPAKGPRPSGNVRYCAQLTSTRIRLRTGEIPRKAISIRSPAACRFFSRCRIGPTLQHPRDRAQDCASSCQEGPDPMGGER